MKTYASLQAGLNDQGIPVGNEAFIRHITEVIGISHYEGTSTYVNAIRTDGGPFLRIAYGFTNGFVSREEAELAAGSATNGAEVWPSRARKGLWGVTHPIHGTSGGGGKRKPGERDYGYCVECNTAITAAGTCLCD